MPRQNKTGCPRKPCTMSLYGGSSAANIVDDDTDRDAFLSKRLGELSVDFTHADIRLGIDDQPCAPSYP